MQYAYTYGDPRKLYLNVTNRCSNRCSFCVRDRTKGLGGAVLLGGEEPDFQSLREAVEELGGPGAFEEFVWCGFGEPTYRVDLMTEAAPWLRGRGAGIRLNTNGHASLIHGRDVMVELAKAAAAVSVSLNAPGRERYVELCRPTFGPAGWDAMLDFLARAPAYFRQVQASVVGGVLGPSEIRAAEALARSLGIDNFRVR